ncbi:hypothetical protein Fmac_029111 [Flemingia macrophylla]|uniref:Uncharacterized protein n=1 Tax=Flemingia macrophylla TaxID=520843 RepID=A0ABD1L9E1_9FABA
MVLPECQRDHGWLQPRKRCLLGRLGDGFSHNRLCLHIIDYVSPFLANLLRCLLDPDSSVPHRCAHTVAALSASHPFSSFFKPLAGPSSRERDPPPRPSPLSTSPPPRHFSPSRPPGLVVLFPRLLKLLGSKVFRAKPPLLTLLATFVQVVARQPLPRLGTWFPTSWRCSAARNGPPERAPSRR